MAVKDIVEYYVKLLILQYRGKQKASAHIRAFAEDAILPEQKNSAIIFSSIPDEGFFEFGVLIPSVESYPLVVTVGYSDSSETIQDAIRALTPALSEAVVTGDLLGSGLVIIFNNDDASLDLTDTYFNSLKNSEGVAVTVSQFNNDRTIPLAIQDAFNIDPALGATAVGDQLDVVGKYVGVERRVKLINGTFVSLSDSDFLNYVRLSAVFYHLGAPLKDIDDAIDSAFPGVLFAIDNQDMTMDYLVNSELVSGLLLNVLVANNKLPKPMAVRLSNVIYAPPVSKIFSFSSYEVLAPEGTGFNSYDDYNTDTHFLSYIDSVYPI